MNALHFTTHLCVSQQEMAATADDMMVIINGLGNNILQHLGNVALGRSIRIFLRDEESRVAGGITAELFGGWAYISLLWVDESLINQGFGTELLKRLESEVIRLGCKHAQVDTYSFEAKPFYERAG